jgi:ribosome-associated protein
MVPSWDEDCERGQEQAVIEPGHGVRIPLREVTLRASRAGGPGGQSVNTTDSRVELRWDVASSPSLTEPQRDRVLGALAHRLTADGVLLLHASEHRSQLRNREAVLVRLTELLRAALTPEQPRRPTRRTLASRERRLRAKHVRSDRKALRRPPED